jgi:hypothetical protein
MTLLGLQITTIIIVAIILEKIRSKKLNQLFNQLKD